MVGRTLWVLAVVCAFGCHPVVCFMDWFDLLFVVYCWLFVLLKVGLWDWIVMIGTWVLRFECLGFIAFLYAYLPLLL